METGRLARGLVAIAAVGAGLGAGGCSAVGYGIGSAVNGKGPHYEEIARPRLVLVEPGKEVVVEMTDGTRRVGIFRRYDRVEDAFVVETGEGDGAEETLSVDRIERIEVRIHKHGKTYGAVIGGLIDAAIIIGLATYDWGSIGFGSGSGGSGSW